jgi:hypothetical protein
MVLNRDRICEMCGEVPSVVADHIIGLKDGGTWELSNGQGLCKHCDGVKGMPERFGTGGPANLDQGGSKSVSGRNFDRSATSRTIFGGRR